MPIYEYVCEECNNHLELLQKITEKPLTICPCCKGQLKKMISNTSFVLKGTGWYVTDYASNKGTAPKTTAAPKQNENTTASTDTSTEPAPKTKEPAAAGAK